MLLPALPFVAVMAGLSAAALCLWPKSRSSARGVLLFMLPLASGFWLIHGGVFASLIGGTAQPFRGLWAFGLWLRILSVVSASRLWLAYVPPPLLIRSLLAGRLSSSFAFLLASPLLLTGQIKARIAQIQEAQLARGISVHGTFRERASALTALLFPLVLGLLNDLPSRSAALDMKAFGLYPRRSSLFSGKSAALPFVEAPGSETSSESQGTTATGDADRIGEPAAISENLQVSGSCPAPLLRLDGAAFTAPGADVPLLTVPALRLASGEWMLLEGGNGSGKSTLAMLLCGGVPEHRSGTLSGCAELSGEPVASRTTLRWSPDVQFVQQNPQLSLSGCAFTLFEEVAFGAENLALPVDEIRDRVEDVLSLLGIAHLRESPPAHLSGGEAQKAALASALAMRPRLLLLDEAFSRIASADIPVLLERLREWTKKRGTAVLLLERNRSPFGRYCDRIGLFRDGLVVEEPEILPGFRAPRAVQGLRSEADVSEGHADVLCEEPASGSERASCGTGKRTLSRCASRVSADGPAHEATVGPVPPAAESLATGSMPLLRISELDFRWKGLEEPLLRSLNASLGFGERAALVGPNGAGKSTLMRLCAGLLAPERGEVLLDGTPVSAMHPKERASRIGFLFQNAERQIFHATVSEEVLFSLRDAPFSREERMERVASALKATGLSGKENKHPLDLNAAERRMVAVASLAVRDAELLLLDEPSRDFDSEWQERFEQWMLSHRGAVLAVSHDPDFVDRLFPQVWRLDEGRLSL